MSLSLREGCALLSDYTGTPVLISENENDIQQFCHAHHFHSSQKSLTPKGLKLILSQLDDTNIISFCDILRMHVVVFRHDGNTVFIGPFCTEELSETAVELLIRQSGVRNLHVRDFRIYRSVYPLRVESDVVRGVKILLSHLSPSSPERRLLSLKDELPKLPDERQYTRENFETLVNERYRVETEMMEMVRQGRAKDAIERHRYLHNNMRFARHIGGTVEGGRISAAVTRTVLRVAVMEAGLPPVLIDQLTGESTNIVQRCAHRDDITRETERLIGALCEAVRRFRTDHLSIITFSALYEMERHYKNPISVEETADKLGVSAGHYIRLFKKETGMTPNAYLTKIRIETASRLLRSTHYTIQEISDQVGIPDANYFVKCFRKIYGITPTQYREGTEPVSLNDD